MPQRPHRRTILKGTIATAGLLTASSSAAETPAPAENSLRYCLNTSTIRGQKLPLDKEIELAARVGYQGLEPWMGEIQRYLEGGGSLRDLRQQIEDSGIRLESAIGFSAWIVDDSQRRKKGLDAMRRDMETLAELGCKRIAAPPSGATDTRDMDLQRIAERYRDLLDLGQTYGVVPQLELWGFSKTLHRLGELAYVATEAAHPNACLLLDVYHIYKGGSDFQGLTMLNGQSVHVLHMNDYPEMSRDKIGDADRVYPGDGVAPVPQVLRTLLNGGFRGVLSLELFNREYWQQDAEAVAKRGLQSMQQSVARAIT